MYHRLGEGSCFCSGKLIQPGSDQGAGRPQARLLTWRRPQPQPHATPGLGTSLSSPRLLTWLQLSLTVKAETWKRPSRGQKSHNTAQEVSRPDSFAQPVRHSPRRRAQLLHQQQEEETESSAFVPDESMRRSPSTRFSGTVVSCLRKRNCNGDK